MPIMETLARKNIDNLDLYQRRMEIMVGAELRREDKIADAIKIQDDLRKRIKNWDGASEIRKWREKRA